MKPFMDKIDKAVQQMKDAAAFIAMQGKKKKKGFIGHSIKSNTDG